MESLYDGGRKHRPDTFDLSHRFRVGFLQDRHRAEVLQKFSDPSWSQARNV